MVGGMPVPQVKCPPSDRASGKRPMTERESIDAQNDKAGPLPIVFGTLLGTTYIVQDDKDALEFAKSEEDEDRLEKQRVSALASKRARLEAEEKVLAEALEQELIETQRLALLASKRAEVEAKEKALSEQLQQTDDQFFNARQFAGDERMNFEMAMFATLHRIGESPLFFELYDRLISSMVTGETSLEKGYYLITHAKPVEEMQAYFIEVATKYKNDFEWVEPVIPRQTRSKGSTSSDAGNS